MSTKLAIKAALKAARGADKPKRISDGEGLYLEVRPGGAGWWRLRYFFQGKERMLSLGTYPEVQLVLAQERRDAARQLAAASQDPSEARKAEKAVRRQHQVEQDLEAAGKPAPGRFEQVAREWLSSVREAAVSAGHAERTAHGFRAMARTLAAERLGIAPEVIEAQLAHAKSGPLGAAYDRAQYLYGTRLG